MPRFYTHVSYDGGYARDIEGQQFATLAAACECARRSARRIICERIDAGHDVVKLGYELHDEAGSCLAVIPICAIVSGLD